MGFNMLRIKLYLKFINFISIVDISFTNFFTYFSLYQNFNHKNLIFFREGMMIDCLQKLSFDKLAKKLFIQSMQFFNFNFYNYKLIRFVIDELYSILNFLFNKGDDLNFHNVI